MPEKSKRNLPDWLDGFMLLTDNSEPPVLFRKWTAISTIASALQRKVYLQLGLSLVFYPNFYIVLVGPPATGKGTAMRFAQDIIDRVSAIKLSAQATSLQALIRRMKQTNLTDIDYETGEQMFHASMTIFSNEFTVFLGYHNQELIAALCDWFDCTNRWSYDTIKRDKEEIIGVWVNLLGGTTADNLQSSLPIEAIGGGLTTRIIFVNEDKRAKLVIFPTATPRELQLQELLIKDLEQIALMSGAFHYTEDALALYSDWCMAAAATPPFADRKFDGYCGRRRKHLNALAMVLSASRSPEMIIRRGDLERAIAMLTEVEVKMATVFRGIGRSDISVLLNDAITFITNSSTPDIPLFMFARRFEGDVDKMMLDRILFTLEAMKYIVVIKRPGTDSVIHILKKDQPKNVQSTSSGNT